MAFGMARIGPCRHPLFARTLYDAARGAAIRRGPVRRRCADLAAGQLPAWRLRRVRWRRHRLGSARVARLARAHYLATCVVDCGLVLAARIDPCELGELDTHRLSGNGSRYDPCAPRRPLGQGAKGGQQAAGGALRVFGITQCRAFHPRRVSDRCVSGDRLRPRDPVCVRWV